MRYGLFLLLSLFMWQACDVEDKGNYDYDYQNGVTITFADEEMNQTLEKGVDTLKIHPPGSHFHVKRKILFFSNRHPR